MDIAILGPLTVTHDGTEIPITAPMQRALLILLAIHPDTSLSTDRIIDALWDDNPPRNGLRTLRFHVSKLRADLGPAASSIVTTPDGYRLDTSDIEIDATQFEELVRTGTELVDKQPERAGAVLQNALDLWRGDALADVAYRVFAVPEATRLTELHTTARESLIDAKLYKGTNEPIIADIRAMLDAHPHRERLWRSLLLALYRQQGQADALHAYQEAKDALAELGLAPSAELQHLEEQILLDDLALAVATTEVPGNLPLRVSSFVGRDDDLAQVIDLLDHHRLVTITGAGGVGKTSLAIEAARALAARFADGTWLVELASQSDSELLQSEIATALQITETGRRSIGELLTDRLRNESVLIVLDNCEHLIEAAAAFTDALVSQCPAVSFLVTSRQALRIPGEATMPLDPLATQQIGREGRSPAADLFVERAAGIDTRLRDDLDNDPAVETICRRLDGIPLAIEMAAARIRSMPAESILERFDRIETLQSASRLASPRHQSMTAAVEWSYRQLTEAQKTVFRRIAVFRGSFTLSAVEAVAADGDVASGDVADLVDALVGASLVSPLIAEFRFRMLEPIRQFAEGLGVDDGAARRHAQYYCGLAERAYEHKLTSQMPRWADRLRLERPNLRRALDWAGASAAHRLGLRLAGALGPYWPSREWVSWFAPLLDVSDGEPSVELAGALNYGVHHALNYLNLDDARRWLPATFEAARAVSAREELAWAYGSEALLAMRELDQQAAIVSYEHQARLAKELNDDTHLYALDHLAEVLVYIGEYDRAESVTAEVRARAAATGNEFRLFMADLTDGIIALYRGNLTDARQKIEPTWSGLRRFDNQALFWTGTYLVRVLAAQGDIGAAGRVVDELAGLLHELDPDDAAGRAWVELCRARVAIAAGRNEDAINACRVAIVALAREAHLPTLLILTDDLAQALAGTGEPTLATKLLGGVDTLRATFRIPRPDPELACFETTLADVRHTLGADAVDAAWGVGEAFNANQLYAAALAATGGDEEVADVSELVWTG